MHPPAHPRLADALARIEAQARPAELAGMARFGLTGEGRLGLSVPSMRAIAKAVGRDHALAQALWDTGIPDARIVASLVAEPARFTPQQMDAWAQGFAAWDVCDQVCQNAFSASPLAWTQVRRWHDSPQPFVRRAAFALLAVLAVHDKAAADARFTEALALIQAAATDERNFVKKAVNWALRNIGKRNPVLHQAALACAVELQAQGAAMKSRSARWIAADALRELRSEAVLARLAKRR